MKRREFIKYGAALAGFCGACLMCRNINKYTRLALASEVKNPMDTIPCKAPFENFDIKVNGECSPCCFLKNDISAGNIEKQTFDEIWNGEVYTDLRRRMLKGDFSMCKRDVCSLYNLCKGENISPDYKKGPKELKLSYDFECNYNCITCRDVVKVNTPEEMKLYDEVYLPKIMKLAQNAAKICLIGSGDVFYSRHAKKLIKALVKNYPELKFTLYSNGFLMNEKTLKEFGIENNVEDIYVSVNAANRETYKKIMRTDGFDVVMKNLKVMSEYKKQGKIKWVGLNFVTHIMNYKEMPEFVKIAQKLDIGTYFSTYRPWTSAEYYKRYDEVAVFEPTNKHYKELVKILHNPIFKDSHCYLEQRLADIANS